MTQSLSLKIKVVDINRARVKMARVLLLHRITACYHSFCLNLLSMSLNLQTQDDGSNFFGAKQFCWQKHHNMVSSR